MSIRENVTKWKNVGRFCAERVADYGELISVEFEEIRKRLVRELCALVLMAVAALFTVSFFCVAIIATAWGTPHFLGTVWGIAAAWLLLSIIALCVARSQRLGPSLRLLQQEMRDDLDTLREALK
ncbi:hypothetical protein bAD24_III10330 [Burkholderia sp. AD24]|nr:hypothetical protein bAD24_III10330 [Burkholderia sp. AD24]